MSFSKFEALMSEHTHTLILHICILLCAGEAFLGNQFNENFVITRCQFVGFNGATYPQTVHYILPSLTLIISHVASLLGASFQICYLDCKPSVGSNLL